MSKINPKTGGEEWSTGEWVCVGITVAIFAILAIGRWLGWSI